MKYSSYAVDYIRTEMRIALGINTSKIDAAINAVPLDAPLQSDDAEGATLADMIAAPEPDENELELSELQSAVRAAVGRIENSLSRHAIEEYYFNEKQMTQIAAEQEVSEQCVGDRINRGHRALYNDLKLRKWLIDYEYDNVEYYRLKGWRGYISSNSSVVEDVVEKLEELDRRKSYIAKKIEEQAALASVLGELFSVDFN
jgi:predicted DNA-binding protein YlxM (UPF0122 family)